MERIKDILFDLSDVVISLVIVVLIFAVVSWKLNEAMPMAFSLADVPDEDSPATSVATSPVEISVEAGTGTNVDNSTIVSVGPITDGTPTAEATVIGSNEGNTTPQPLTVKNDTNDSTPSTSPSKKVTIEIPSGSTGDKIGRILKDKGLISDVKAFNKAVEDMGLGNKLRAGTFTLATNMNLEEVIKKITGQK